MSARSEKTWLVCYDVAGPKRLRKLGRRMERFGQRIQYSIFLCLLDDPTLRELKDMIHRTIDPAEDRVLLLPLCARCETSRIEIGLTTWHQSRKTAVFV